MKNQGIGGKRKTDPLLGWVEEERGEEGDIRQTRSEKACSRNRKQRRGGTKEEAL